MTKQEIIEQLKNIKDQYLNDSSNEIDADDIIEAITDVIHDVEGNDGMMWDDEDDYGSYEETDFTKFWNSSCTKGIKRRAINN